MASVNVNYKVIGLNVSMYRLSCNMTQEQLAEKAGISKQFVCNIECGRGVPSLKTILSLCNALNVSADDLLRCSATYDPEAPCTLRETHDIFANTLTDRLFSPESKDSYINPDDLPAFDITLPDPNEDTAL